jgi:hypothetical protein
MSEHNDVARMMIDMLNEGTPNSTMGHAFKNAAQRTKLAQIEAELAAQEEEEIRRKVAFLLECEEKKDLGWMDYPSWYSLPVLTRQRFDLVVDPLKSGSGVYYCRSLMNKNTDDIYQFLTTAHSCFELLDTDSYRLVVVGDGGSIYDVMGIQKLAQVQKEFRERLIRSFGVNNNGAIIRKEMNNGTAV